MEHIRKASEILTAYGIQHAVITGGKRIKISKPYASPTTGVREDRNGVVKFGASWDKIATFGEIMKEITRATKENKVAPVAKFSTPKGVNPILQLSKRAAKELYPKSKESREKNRQANNARSGLSLKPNSIEISFKPATKKK